MALVEAARFHSRVEASIAKGALDAADIPSILFDTEMNLGGGGIGSIPVRLMVHDDDLIRACQFLAEASSSGA
jgi:Putative prokaryotic signal transducing protein